METSKVDWSELEAVVQVTGFRDTKGDFPVSMDYIRRLRLPREFKLPDIQRAQRDCEILAAKLRSNAEDVAPLLKAILGNDTEEARRRAKGLGLTEEEFTAQGGGLMWLVVILVVLYATDAL